MNRTPTRQSLRWMMWSACRGPSLWACPKAQHQATPSAKVTSAGQAALGNCLTDAKGNPVTPKLKLATT